jgi:hypothetical protein
VVGVTLILVAGGGMILVAGGGMVGCEVAQVTIVETMPRVLAAEDEDISAIVHREMKKAMIKVITGVRIENIHRSPDGTLTSRLSNGLEIGSQQVLVSVGRSLNSEDLRLEDAGLAAGPCGEIQVDEARKKLRIVIKLQEGPQYRIRQLNVTGNKLFTEANSPGQACPHPYHEQKHPRLLPWRRNSCENLQLAGSDDKYHRRKGSSRFLRLQGSQLRKCWQVLKNASGYLEWLRANGHPKWKSVDLNAPVKGWEQYDCVRKYLQPSQRPAAERSRDVNPVLDAIKKMFSD